MSELRKQGRPKSKQQIANNYKVTSTNMNQLRELSEKSYNPMSIHIRQAEYLEKTK